MVGTTTAKKPKSPRAYPSFHVMISDAILTLKERTGSSQYAITKFLEEKHKKQLPANFRKLLLVQLKKLVTSEKLVKVKNSFKLPSARSSPAKKPQATKATSAKPKLKKVTTSTKPKLKNVATSAKPKPKAKVATKPKVKTPVKAKPASKPKKAVAKPSKVARTKKVASPGKKKAVAVKPKSKSPVVKRGAAKK